MEGIFDRTTLLLGQDATERLAQLNVIVFGVGGVGSWCAEALARSGVGNITLVDSDCVAPSNINRQLVALHSTLGQPKVSVMEQRIADINPQCNVKALQCRYTPQTADDFRLETFDYVVDAIDSLSDKAHLIVHTTSLKRPRLFSSMGAALKTDAAAICVDEFWNVKGCPLARALRQHFKRTGIFPKRKFRCVYSPQLVKNRSIMPTPGPISISSQAVPGKEKTPNGTVVYATAPFGLRLAQLVVTAATTPTTPMY